MNPERPLFGFKLRDLTEIVPWGKGGDLSLSWFGLTDGWYWMNVGHEQLFVSPDQGAGPACVDYQVARLWEDVLDVLPVALEPVPAALGTLLEPANGWLAWQQRAWAADDGARDLFEQAAGWATSRRLDTLHLAAGPNVWFCRVDERMRILWDNRDRVVDGKPVWTASCGLMELSVDEFLAEVSGLHDGLIRAMSERARAIHESWSRKDIRIDLPMLDEEQRDRSTWLSNALERAASHPLTDWNAVSEGLRLLEVKLR